LADRFRNPFADTFAAVTRKIPRTVIEKLDNAITWESHTDNRERETMHPILIFHAIFNYAYLTPDRYEFVIRRAYEMIIDNLSQSIPVVRLCLRKPPDILWMRSLNARRMRLKKSCKRVNRQAGQCEIRWCSPYAHPDACPQFSG
jgi:hypothetical protein